ncbi:MAG: NADP-dependent oxidoreductase [Anaerolineaceae bacterium]|nr:NADP-dependent oxidoreductase [Anaerolineaceae bacterium]
MKAMRIHAWGEPLRLDDVPRPEPGDGQILVRVRASSVNPIDYKIAEGAMKSMLSLPLTPGTDVAGEVVAVGSGIQHVKPGDGVFGMLMNRGAFAEYAIAEQREVARKPRSLDFSQAAAVPVTALTAWQTLFELAQLQSGERLLIHGAAGGIGTYAVQLAKQKGAYVIGNDRADKEGYLRELGVDRAIDARTQRLQDAIGTVDVVLDLVGGDMVQRSLDVLGRGGRYVTPAGQPPEEEAARRGIQAHGIFTQPTVRDLASIAEQIDAGRLRVVVSRTFPLEQAQAALDFKEEGETYGKVVITVD